MLQKNPDLTLGEIRGLLRMFAAPPAEGEPVIENIELVIRPLHETQAEDEEQGG